MIILYPTETLYALGTNAHDNKTLNKLFELKGRDSKRVATWLVRNITDIEEYAELGEKGTKIASQFLPGPLTLVLKIKTKLFETHIPKLNKCIVAEDGTIGFRISADPIAQNLITAYMEDHQAPLTCTSANISGSPVFPTVGEILQQFGEKAHLIDQVIDDGVRKNLASTIVRIVDNEVKVLREGEITEEEIIALL